MCTRTHEVHEDVMVHKDMRWCTRTHEVHKESRGA